jgi:c(7)-type cytochrome triheme protein
MAREREAVTRTATVNAIRLVVVAVASLFFGYLLISCTSPTDDPSSNAEAGAYEPLPANADNAAGNLSDPLANISSDSPELAVFGHTNQYHSQLSCLICHRRDSNSARISLPGKENHSPCIGCHTQQFANKKSSICTVCHTDAESGALKGFPPLRSFGVKFDHSKHTRKTNCATCHRPFSRGVALSIPNGRNAHTTCFQCHSSQASHNMSSCGVCHQPGSRPGPAKIAKPAFSRNFSHAKHKAMTCAECHNARSGARGKQVSAPVARMHNQTSGVKSCASCHNDQRAFGAEDFSNCKRCHLGDTFKFPKQRL